MENEARIMQPCFAMHQHTANLKLLFKKAYDTTVNNIKHANRE